jgi:hypothetical protein
MRYFNLLAVAVVPLLAASGADTPAAGTVKFELRTSAAFNVYTDAPTPTVKAWMQSHLWRFQTCSPYFDAQLSWMPNTWAYIDLYAVYTNSTLAATHPEWILRDGSGNKLYIPWGCANGTCPQYAADVSDPGFRSWWISNATAELSAGYKGVWIDDVNLEFRVADGNGNEVAPIDHNTGAPMTADNWRLYVAQFVEQIRAALPAYEILHNAIWYASPTEYSDQYVLRQIKAADYINLERGISDAGLTGMTGKYSVGDFIGYVDVAHAYGKNVVFDELSRNGDYGLAGYFLINNGNDALGDQTVTPDNWWTGYNVNLGAPQGARYTWYNLLRRDFAQGFVLLNPPKTAPVTVTLPGPMTKLDDGTYISSITLNPGQAVVLTGTYPAADFSLSAGTSSQTVTAGGVASFVASVSPLYGFTGSVALSVTGLPAGASASFSPATISASGQSTLSVATSGSTPAGSYQLKISGISGGLNHTTTLTLTVNPAPVVGPPVPIASAYNRTGMVTDGTAITDGGLDTYGFAYSANLLGTTQTLKGVTYNFAAPNVKNAVTSATIALTQGKFIALNLLATGVSGAQTAQPFIVKYTDGSTSVFTQSLSDWFTPQNFPGETTAIKMAYRNTSLGTKDNRTFNLYSYSFALDRTKTVSSLTLPNNGNVVVLAIAFSAPVPVNLSASASRWGYVTDGTKFTSGGLDTYGFAYSANLLTASRTWNNTPFTFGAANTANAVTSATITLPNAPFSSVSLLATGFNGGQTSQVFTVKYTDGTSASFTQSLSDWHTPANYSGETNVVSMAYRNTSSGTKDSRAFYLYGYSFALDKTKTVSSIALPKNGSVVLLALTLVP